MHLSPHCAAADEGVLPPDGTAGEDERYFTALAKISGLKYCEFLNRQYGTDYIPVMPTNLYGLNDNYHPTHSHVLPALIRRFHEAKVSGAPSVTCWGDGSPLREFLYVDDLANLCVFLMNGYSGNETVNAYGEGDHIKELTRLVAKVVGYEGEILWDASKPNGTPRKLRRLQSHGLGLDLQDGTGGRNPSRLRRLPPQPGEGGEVDIPR